MPEMPEVETVRATLSSMIVGKTIDHILVRYPKMIQPDTPESFSNSLSHQTLESIERYGKYLFFHFQTDTLISHLRMEGKYFLRPQSEPVLNHEHVIFYFTDGLSLRYHDTRKFGTMQRVPRGTQFSVPGIIKMGPEPISNDLTVSYLLGKTKNSFRPVKTFLLDQTVVSGLGNIYVDEVLFYAKLHPLTPVNQLTKNDIVRIIDGCKSVISRAIELGGSTIRSYVSSLGVTGRFQTELAVHMRKDELCNKCESTIIKIKVGGRGTYYCPLCQKEKRKSR